MLYFEEIEKDEYRERESKNVGPKEAKVRREERSNVRFPPTGSFGELEQRQRLHVINRNFAGA